ncbi:MAG TPA: bifunctional UDP-N-acetylglucosamine diphosphorylase/glucosamine-1-phosphate N-acetyltransferase GlmU [Thermodesulfobacteriota bacterium]|nr:bifunctional UDP-N-acetylglucosamine diphosphorylase/glucosamine-1-phosphate N-acetyltransferase GlmU [Thermodesulfobacteriota bacterium]
MAYSVIVLAAGRGKRMKSECPKVLHPILGLPMLSFVLDAVMKISPERIVVVVGFGKEEVNENIQSDRIEYVLQGEQLGTGHAVMCAEKALRDFRGTVIIVNGDFPLIRPETLSSFINSHDESGATLTLLTTTLDNPYGYGRIIRNKKGGIIKVVEEKDATPNEKDIKEINAGTYCVESGFLWRALSQTNTENEQQEYYLPDIVKIASRNGGKVNGFTVPDSEEVLGVNNRAELAKVERILRKRRNEDLMLSGVTIIDPEVTYISPRASVGADSVIYPNTFIYGNTTIGNKCSIGPSVWIHDSKIGDEVTIKFSSYVTESEIGDKATVGPFAHIRPQVKIFSEAKIGNFVEIKKSNIGHGSKVPHLSYVGDAEIGEKVNIGAGTVTCNYDGFWKHETVIEDEVFIGSDTMLVAPVRIGRGATTGAGSTITKDVPEGALAIGRARQVVINDWKRKPREKKPE